MKYFDVFNGDADGICALHQLRLAEPRPEAELITGVKRDIRLLDRLVDAEQAEITVLDLSLDSNRHSLEIILLKNRVLYIDHHYAGELPGSANLVAHIDPDPELCTALIVDRLLGGRYRTWAITGAFGDNLHNSALQASGNLSLSSSDLATLRNLGELLNYNGYGKTVADLYFHPVALYNAVKRYEDPLEFYHSSEQLRRLREGFESDMNNVRRSQLYRDLPAGRVFSLPADSWSRRVAGVFINEKAREQEKNAHCLLVDNGDNTFMVSIRAPLANRTGADQLCRAFPTGGGRPGAAGVNELPAEMLENFLTAFNSMFAE